MEHSFRKVAEDFLKRHVEANGLRTGKEVRRYLETYVSEFKRKDGRLFGDVPFVELMDRLGLWPAFGKKSCWPSILKAAIAPWPSGDAMAWAN